MIDQTELRPMDIAPRDGTPIFIRFEHMNFKYAVKDGDGERWEALQSAHWIDHNGGGWTWHGMAGYPTGWKPGQLIHDGEDWVLCQLMDPIWPPRSQP